MAGYGRQNVIDPVFEDRAAADRLQLSGNIVEHLGHTGFTKNGRCPRTSTAPSPKAQ